MSYAQSSDSAPWYQVELMVFSQPGNPIGDELWSPETRPAPHPQALRLTGAQAKERGLSLDKQTSNPIAINHAQLRNRGYQILFHRSWIQPLLDRNQAMKIRITGGDQLTEETPAATDAYGYTDPSVAASESPISNYYQLDGDITLDISRYLHLRTNLFYTLHAPDYWRNHSARLDSTALDNQAASTQQSTTDPAAPQPSVSAATANAQKRYITAHMEQARRMRGGELHYLDHPLFGLLIKLTPVERPSSTAAAQ